MIDDSHICPTPITGRKSWWDCPACGQLWRKVNGVWRLTAREAQS